MVRASNIDTILIRPDMFTPVVTKRSYVTEAPISQAPAVTNGK